MSHKRKYQFIDDQAIDDDDIEDQDDSLDDGSEDSLDDFIESEGKVESESENESHDNVEVEEEIVEFDPEHFRTFLELEVEADPSYLSTVSKKEIIDHYKSILFRDAIDLTLSKEERRAMFDVIVEVIEAEEDKGKKKQGQKLQKVEKKVEKKVKKREEERQRLDTIMQKLKLEEPKKVKAVVLKPYQKVAHDFLFSGKVKGLLVYHDVGLGKTYIAIMAIKQALETNLVKKVVVVLPQKVIPKFSAELIDHLDPKYKKQVFFYTFRMLQQVMQDEDGSDICASSLLVIDEAHRAKGYMLSARHKRSQSSLLRTCAVAASKVLLLTATAIEQELDDLRNLLHMITPNPGTQTEYPHMDPSTSSDLKEILGCRISYVTQEELGEEKPQIVEDFLSVPMTEDDWQEYKVAEETYQKKYQTNVDQRQTALYNDIRKMLLESKFPGIIKYILEHTGERMVIYNTYVEEGLKNLYDILIKRKAQDPSLEFEVGVVTGSTSSEEADRLIQDFNNEQLNVLLISKAASEGIEIRNTDTLLIAEQNWLFTEDQQLLGRVCRPQTITHDAGSDAVLRVYHVMASPPSAIALHSNKLIDRYMYDRKQLYKHKFVNEIEPILKKWRIESFQDCDDMLFTLQSSKNKRSRGRPLYNEPVPVKEDDYSMFMKKFKLSAKNEKDRQEFSDLVHEAERYEFNFWALFTSSIESKEKKRKVFFIVNKEYIFLPFSL